MNLIYKTFTNDVCNNDYRYQSQIRAASVSSMTNIAEGFNRYHKKDFIRFLDISQSSAAEVQSLVYDAIDQKYINQKEFEFLYNQASETIKTTLGFIKYLNSILINQAKHVIESDFNYSIDKTDYWNLPDEFIIP